MEDLVYLYAHVDILLIIFCRIIPTILFLPIIEESRVPKMVTVGLSLCLAIAVFMVTDCSQVYYNPTLVSYTMLLIREMLVGLIIGFIFKIFFQIYQFVGTLWSTQGGLGMSMALDPVGGVEAPIIGRFYNLCFCAIFILGGGYHWFIKTLVESFTLIPINKVVLGTHLVAGTVSTIGNYLLIGLKLAMPILSILILIDVGLGILARAVPQMNMFVIGIPLKIVILFVLMIVTISLVPIFNNIIIDEMVNTIMNLIQGMRPL